MLYRTNKLFNIAGLGVCSFVNILNLQINSYLKNLTLQYPEVATLENIGKSGEGRDLLGVKISSGANSRGICKPLILIDGGIHADEWLGPAQTLYIIQQLVENPNNRNLIKNVDWVVLPVVNPDGYEFTFTVSRMWRKTRSKGINCIGTDANRNFDFHWGEDGANADECDSRYHGPNAFSEPETRALRDVILKYSKRTKLYITFHTYGQLVLYPWGYTTAPPSNVDELDSLGKRVASAIENVSGTHFVTGSVPELLYKSSGDSMSWAKGVAGVELAYAIELAPALNSTVEEIPLDQIKFAVAEVFEGVKVFHDYIQNKYA